MSCNIKYAHVAPENVGGLINYSIHCVHLQYPKNDHLRHRGQDQLLSLVTQSFHSIDIQ